MKQLSKKYITYISFLLVFSFKCSLSAQQLNWVVNGNFEEFTECPYDFGQIKLCNGWDTLRNGGGGNPEYFNTCYGFTGIAGVPNNLMVYQNPHSGKGYSDLFSYYIDPSIYVQREYIQGTLKENLIQGKTYCVTYYVSFGYDFSKHAIDRLGAYLDDGSVSSPYFGVAAVKPQIESPSIQNGGQFLTDTLGWMKIQGVFTAKGTESYINLGSYVPNATTNALEYGSCDGCGSYYYVDDVSVIDINKKAYAGRDTVIAAGDSVFIGTPDIGDHFNWYANGTLFKSGSEAGFWVKPGQSTNYICEQYVCSSITRDTVTIKVSKVGTLDFEKALFRLSNNPSTDGHIQIRAPKNNKITLQVYSALGDLILKEELIGVQGLFSSTLTIRSGIYSISITADDGSHSIQKWVVL